MTFNHYVGVCSLLLKAPDSYALSAKGRGQGTPREGACLFPLVATQWRAFYVKGNGSLVQPVCT